MSERYFKVLRAGNIGTHTDFQWPMPKGKRPGKWLPPVEGELRFCGNGYHVLKAAHLLLDDRMTNPTICEVEVRGDVLHGDDKLCVRQARIVKVLNWDDRSARLLAADYAWHVLKFYEQKFPGDKRVRKCIQTARRFANGTATSEELDATWHAARAAAWATRAAAWAAWDAAWAATEAAEGAIWATARAAAQATGAAEVAAERHWQTERLLEYLDGRRG